MALCIIYFPVLKRPVQCEQGQYALSDHPCR